MGVKGTLGLANKEKIYSGVYEYVSDSATYAHENFEVHKDSIDRSLQFFSSMSSRVSTGELLLTKVEYLVTADMVPQKVTIERDLGKRNALEIYVNDIEKSILNYFFVAGEDKRHIEIPVGSRFHITTPTTVSSMLFMNSKRESTTDHSYYSVYVSNNQWKFLESPTVKSLISQRESTSSEIINIGGINFPFLQYSMHEYEDAENIDDISSKPALQISMNRKISIPYVLKDQFGTIISMVDFVDLNSE